MLGLSAEANLRNVSVCVGGVRRDRCCGGETSACVRACVERGRERERERRVSACWGEGCGWRGEGCGWLRARVSLFVNCGFVMTAAGAGAALVACTV